MKAYPDKHQKLAGGSQKEHCGYNIKIALKERFLQHTASFNVLNPFRLRTPAGSDAYQCDRKLARTHRQQQHSLKYTASLKTDNIRVISQKYKGLAQ